MRSRRSRSDWLEEPGQEATYQKLVATIPVMPRVALYSIQRRDTCCQVSSSGALDQVSWSGILAAGPAGPEIPTGQY